MIKHTITILTASLLISCKNREVQIEAPPSSDSPATTQEQEPVSKETEKAKPTSPSADHSSSQAKSEKPSQPDPEMPKPLPKSKYKTAKATPGKPGYVTNPFTGGNVDVRGIPPGSLVRDPNDPNPDHKFRMPQLED
ncbi:MAG: hypothetical protein ABF377_10030 [Akkermansiaceae bacterium]